MTRMRSIYEALNMIKADDPETALTYNSIKSLCLNGYVRYFCSGKKIILNFDDLLSILGVKQSEGIEAA